MPRYFHHIGPTSRALIFWRDVQTFPGVKVHINLNLLAAAVGDTPPSGLSLVPHASYETEIPAVESIELQPFVELRGTTPIELSIGPKLKNRLDYPLGNLEKLN